MIFGPLLRKFAHPCVRSSWETNLSVSVAFYSQFLIETPCQTYISLLDALFSLTPCKWILYVCMSWIFTWYILLSYCNYRHIFMFLLFCSFSLFTLWHHYHLIISSVLSKVICFNVFENAYERLIWWGKSFVIPQLAFWYEIATVNAVIIYCYLAWHWYIEMVYVLLWYLLLNFLHLSN